MRGFGIGKPLRGSATIVGARRGDIALGSVARSRLSHVTLSENGEVTRRPDTTAEILAERLSRMIEFPGEVDKAAPLWAFRVRMANYRS